MEQVGRVEVHPEAPRVEAIQEGVQHRARLQAGLEGQNGTDAVAVAAQYPQGFGQEDGARVVGFLGDAAGLDDGDAGPQVDAEAEHRLGVVDALLLAFRAVQTASQRAAQRGQFQVIGPQQVAECAAAGMRQGVRRQVAGRVRLHAPHAEPLRLPEGPA